VQPGCHKARELPKEEFQQAVERELTGKASEPRIPCRTRVCANRSYAATAGAANSAVICRIWKFITKNFAVTRAPTQS